MAAVEKIYGNAEQYREFKAWCAEHKPGALKYFYDWYPEWNDGGNHPMTNFPTWIDMWLLDNCPITWVTDYIREQYGR